MSHECPAHECLTMVPDGRLACRPHWYELPRPLRDRIWETYRNGAGGPDHTEAVREAIRYLRAKPEAVGPDVPADE